MAERRKVQAKAKRRTATAWQNKAWHRRGKACADELRIGYAGQSSQQHWNRIAVQCLGNASWGMEEHSREDHMSRQDDYEAYLEAKDEFVREYDRS